MFPEGGAVACAAELGVASAMGQQQRSQKPTGLGMRDRELGVLRKNNT